MSNLAFLKSVCWALVFKRPTVERIINHFNHNEQPWVQAFWDEKIKVHLKNAGLVFKENILISSTHIDVMKTLFSDDKATWKIKWNRSRSTPACFSFCCKWLGLLIPTYVRGDILIKNPVILKKQNIINPDFLILFTKSMKIIFRKWAKTPFRITVLDHLKL